MSEFVWSLKRASTMIGDGLARTSRSIMEASLCSKLTLVLSGNIFFAVVLGVI